MIVDFFIDLGRNIVSWLFSLFPAGWDLPSWMGQMVGFIAGFVSNAANLGVWIPWGVLFAVVVPVLALWGIGLGIRVLRWLIGLIPTMGGGS